MELTELLTNAGVLIPAGLPGLYARTGRFEALAEALLRVIGAIGADDGAEVLRFPPVMDQRILQRNGYFIGFPHLAGCVHSFAGSESEHKQLLYQLLSDEPAGEHFVPNGCALTPAACYPVYPLIAGRGALPPEGALVNVESYCYRHEPSDDPARMQSFRMHEYVRIGHPDQVRRFRDEWQLRAASLMDTLGLAGQLEPAHDPFFGAAGATLAAGQAAEGLKLEMLVPVSSSARRIACMSFNYHDTHFSSAWNIRLGSGALAHTACVGFGIERLVLAMFVAHGPHFDGWPGPVRQALWPAS